MKNLNHAKVIQAVDKAVQGKREEFVFEFLKGYGIPAATIKRLKMGDKSRMPRKREIWRSTRSCISGLSALAKTLPPMLRRFRHPLSSST